MSSEDEARAARAEARRGRVVLRKTRLGDETDPWPIRGAEAVSLLTRLTLQAYALDGDALLRSSERATVIRFVDRQR